MNGRRSCIAFLVCGLVAGPLTAATHAGGKTSKPVVVAKDPAGDWDAGGGVEGPVGDALGQDLVEGLIGSDGKTVTFVIKVNFLLPIGGTPEFTRYSWEMNVDDEAVQLDGKFTNYSRGICDPTAGTCPPPRDPGLAPFFVRTDCESGGGVTVCQEKGIVEAAFDSAAGTISIPVPMKLLGAKPGSTIAPASFFFGGITAMPSAFASAAGGPSDQMMPTKSYVIPK